jgi:hypothetical protein
LAQSALSRQAFHRSTFESSQEESEDSAFFDLAALASHSSLLMVAALGYLGTGGKVLMFMVLSIERYSDLTMALRVRMLTFATIDQPKFRV